MTMVATTTGNTTVLTPMHSARGAASLLFPRTSFAHLLIAHWSGVHARCLGLLLGAGQVGLIPLFDLSALGLFSFIFLVGFSGRKEHSVHAVSNTSSAICGIFFRMSREIQAMVPSVVL